MEMRFLPCVAAVVVTMAVCDGQISSQTVGPARDLLLAASAQACGRGCSPTPALRCRILRQIDDKRFERVDPQTTVFHSGDRIRLAIDADRDGALFVIQKGSTGRWGVLYPQTKMVGSDHVTPSRSYQVPPADTVLQFDRRAGVEHLFLVLMTSPLATSDEVLAFLRSFEPAPGTGLEADSPGSRDLVIENSPSDRPAKRCDAGEATHEVRPGLVVAVAEITLVHKE